MNCVEVGSTTEVWDLKHLNAIIAGIRGLPITAEAVRVFE